MAATDACFRASPDVVVRDIADGLMLVNIQTGSAFRLNQVGGLVWRCLDGVRDIGAIVAEMEQQYHVGIDILLRDVSALLEELQNQRLISVEARSASISTG